jgi:hypothetical protein
VSPFGRERRLAIVARKPTLEKSGVLPVAGYGLSWEFTLSAMSGSSDRCSIPDIGRAELPRSTLSLFVPVLSVSKMQ